MKFGYLAIFSHWKRACRFIWTNSNSPDPRIFCAKFNWNWLDGSGEEDENVKNIQVKGQLARAKPITDLAQSIFGWLVYSRLFTEKGNLTWKGETIIEKMNI